MAMAEVPGLMASSFESPWTTVVSKAGRVSSSYFSVVPIAVADKD